MPSAQPARAAVALLLASVAATASAASCSGQPPPPKVYPPADASARAQARKERELRKAALEELADLPKKKGDKAKASPTATASAKAPPPKETGTGGAGGAGGDDGNGGAGGAGGGPASAAKPELDGDALCQALCQRALDCAQESMPPELKGSMGPMLDNMKSTCLSRCGEEIPNATGSDLSEVKACIDKPACDDFMPCMSKVLDRLDDD